jgi:hypothetical protein
MTCLTAPSKRSFDGRPIADPNERHRLFRDVHGDQNPLQVNEFHDRATLTDPLAHFDLAANDEPAERCPNLGLGQVAFEPVDDGLLGRDGEPSLLDLLRPRALDAQFVLGLGRQHLLLGRAIIGLRIVDLFLVRLLVTVELVDPVSFVGPPLKLGPSRFIERLEPVQLRFAGAGLQLRQLRLQILQMGLSLAKLQADRVVVELADSLSLLQPIPLANRHLLDDSRHLGGNQTAGHRFDGAHQGHGHGQWPHFRLGDGDLLRAELTVCGRAHREHAQDDDQRADSHDCPTPVSGLAPPGRRFVSPAAKPRHLSSSLAAAQK